MRPVLPREEVHSHAALGDEGDIFVQWQVSHAVTAAFEGDRVYVIRSYDAEWVDDLNNSFDLNAVWQATAQGLEIYGWRG